MTLTRLKIDLSTKYQALCFIDLADINQAHSAVYKIFQQYHKKVYAPDERIVFYSNHCPSNRLLEHIQRAANLLDISSCFIMICGPHNVSENLRLLGYDTSIEYYETTVESAPLTNDQLLDESTLCPLAWSNLAIMNQGVAKACCVYKGIVGSAINQTLESLFYSDTMNKLRTSMLTGQQHSDCNHCWQLEKQNITSNRQWHMNLYAKQFYTNWIDNPKIRMIDFRPSNVCNFKCRICGPESSSLHAYEQLNLVTNDKEIIKLKDINLQGQWFDNNTQFINELIELLPNLINIDFYGGEPFLLKQLPVLLEHAVVSGHAKNIKLHFNTNGSIFPKHLISQLQKFKQVDICVSVDNINKQFEFERGGSWQEVEKNVKAFNNLNSDHFNMSIMPTVNIQNVLYLAPLLNWAKKNNYRVILNYLDLPYFMNIDYMTDAAKKLTIDRYQDHPNSELRNISNRVQCSVGSNGERFVEYTKQLDQVRKENFLDSHREIAIAMGYSV